MWLLRLGFLLFLCRAFLGCGLCVRVLGAYLGGFRLLGDLQRPQSRLGRLLCLLGFRRGRGSFPGGKRRGFC